MEDEETEDFELKGIRWSWLTPVILTTGAIGQTIGVVSELFTDLAVAVARHSVWNAEQKDFAESVTRDIERITNG